jgi:Flagellar hook-length control protein FliK
MSANSSAPAAISTLRPVSPDTIAPATAGIDVRATAALNLSENAELPVGREADPLAVTPGTSESAAARILPAHQEQGGFAGPLGNPAATAQLAPDVPPQITTAAAMANTKEPGPLSPKASIPSLATAASAEAGPTSGLHSPPARPRETANAVAPPTAHSPVPQLGAWTAPSASAQALPVNPPAAHPTQPLIAVSPQGTFAALDAHANAGAPAWLHAGAQHAEAGFQDPSLGWVGVRADLSGGAIHAAIVPGSAEAAQALGAQMPALHAHLAAQDVALATLSLHTATGGSGGDARQMQPGTGDQPQQQDRTPGADGPAVSATHGRSAAAVLQPHPVSPWITTPRSGAHISVMA